MDHNDRARRRTQRQRHGQQSPRPVVSSTSTVDAQQLYGFTAGAQNPTTLAYGSDMTTSDIEGQQSDPYPHYTSQLMYDMADHHQMTTYALQNASQYYLAGPSNPQIPDAAAQGLPAQYPTPSSDPESLLAMAQQQHAPTNPGAYSDWSSQQDPFSTQQQQQRQQQHQPPDQQQRELRPGSPAYDTFQTQLRTIFTLAHDDALRNVGTRLFEMSRFLLGNAEAFGLTRDDAAAHAERLAIWTEFNRAWLVTLQRQSDLTQRVIREGTPLEPHQSLMSGPTLEALSHELVRLCDDVEKHGLVDYEMGVEEEQIMDLLLKCQSLLEDNDDDNNNGGSGSRAERSSGQSQQHTRRSVD